MMLLPRPRRERRVLELRFSWKHGDGDVDSETVGVSRGGHVPVSVELYVAMWRCHEKLEFSRWQLLVLVRIYRAGGEAENVRIFYLDEGRKRIQ
jgi:hypothetical protein